MTFKSQLESLPMPYREKSATLVGHLQQLLFSPKGDLEGLLISRRDSNPIQVTVKSGRADAAELHAAMGKAIEVRASIDKSPKTRDAAHPVYQLIKITKLAGRARQPSRDAKPIRGVVAALHYAKHGEPNGVVLRSGEFIHTRPAAMKKLKLTVGAKVIARGEPRLTVLGTALIEATEVNRIAIE